MPALLPETAAQGMQTASRKVGVGVRIAAPQLLPPRERPTESLWVGGIESNPGKSWVRSPTRAVCTAAISVRSTFARTSP